MEIEAKYFLHEQDYRYWLQIQNETERLGGWSVLAGSRRSIRMHSVYFDTDGGELQKRQMGLRLRNENDRIVFTLKMTLEKAGAKSRRCEWEEELNGNMDDGSALRECLKRLDILGGTDPILGNAWNGLSGLSLRPIAEIRFERRLCLLEREENRAEWALDHGSFIHGSDSQPFAEMEMEMKAGEPDCLIDLESELRSLRPLIPGELSKLERCLLVGK